MSKAKEKEALGKYWLSISVVTYVGAVIENFTGGKVEQPLGLFIGVVATLVFLRIGLNLIRNSENVEGRKVNKRRK